VGGSVGLSQKEKVRGGEERSRRRVKTSGKGGEEGGEEKQCIKSREGGLGGLVAVKTRIKRAGGGLFWVGPQWQSEVIEETNVLQRWGGVEKETGAGGTKEGQRRETIRATHIYPF